MPLMLSKLYHALKYAGVDERLAIEAAEESASFENRFDSIEQRLTRIEEKLGHFEAQTNTRFDSMNTKFNVTLGIMMLMLSGVIGTLYTLARR